MKNVRSKKKLTLGSETIRRLRSIETLELIQVRGGFEDRTHSNSDDGGLC
jgi:hypothetical protein